MVDYVYPIIPAVDPNTSQVIRNTAGQLFAVTDTSFSTPLSFRDLSGVPQTELRVGPLGVTDQFVIDRPEVMWKSGTYIIYLNSPQSMVQNTQSAADAAAASAAIAQSVQASVAALQAQVDLIMQNGGTGTGGGGGGTILTVNGDGGPNVSLNAEDIPDGTVKVIMTKSERDFLQSLRSAVLPTVLPAGATPPDTTDAWYVTPLSGTTTSVPADRRGSIMSAITSAGTALPVPFPTDVAPQVGDVAWIASVHSPSDGQATPAATAPTAAAPAGWTVLDAQNLSVSSRMAIYAKVLTAQDLDPTNANYPPKVTVVSTQRIVAVGEVLHDVVGGLAGLNAAILKDTQSGTAKPSPSLAFTGKVKRRWLYGERRTDAPWGGTFATNGTNVALDTWLVSKSIATPPATITGAVLLALATGTTPQTTSPAGGAGDVWTLTTPSGVTGASLANGSGYTAVVTVATA